MPGLSSHSGDCSRFAPLILEIYTSQNCRLAIDMASAIVGQVPVVKYVDNLPILWNVVKI